VIVYVFVCQLAVEIDAPVAMPAEVVVADSSVYGPAAPLVGFTLSVNATGWPDWQLATALLRAAVGTNGELVDALTGPV
jgi:hypothetical protein